MKYQLFLLFLGLIIIGCLQGGSEDNLRVIVTAGGVPAVNAEVEVYDNSLVESASTDSKGFASFMLSPGEYTVKVRFEDYPEQEKKVTTGEGVVMTEFFLSKEQECNESWECTEWSECLDGKKQRTCVDENECNTTENKPMEEKECEVHVECYKDGDCDDGNVCTKDSCSNHTCFFTEITECNDNDGCCPDDCEGEDEDCEVIECTKESDCANDNDDCTEDYCLNGKCIYAQIRTCKDDDFCCPYGCTYDEDDDCPIVDCNEDSDCDDDNDCTDDDCVNNECEYTDVDDGEDCDDGICCDGECESIVCEDDEDCSSENDCYVNFSCIDGGTCDASCSHDEITECVNYDGCCPDGCSYNDIDCFGTPCETSADCQNTSCRKYFCNNSYCSLESQITQCTNGDGCCPTGCTESVDDDCTDYVQQTTIQLDVGERATVFDVRLYLQSVYAPQGEPEASYYSTLRVGCEEINLLLQDGSNMDTPNEDWETEMVLDQNNDLDDILLFYDTDIDPEDEVTTLAGPEDYFELSYEEDEVSRGEWDAETLTFQPGPGGTDLVYSIEGFTSYDNQCSTTLMLSSGTGYLWTFLSESPEGYIGTSPTNLFDIGVSRNFILDSKPIKIENMVLGTAQDAYVTLKECDDSEEIININTPTCSDEGNGWVHCSSATVFGEELELRYTYNITMAGKSFPVVQVMHGADQEVDTLYGKLVWPSDNTDNPTEVTFTDSSGTDYLIKPHGISYKVTNPAETFTYVNPAVSGEQNENHWTETLWIESSDIDESVTFINPENNPRTQRAELCSSQCISEDYDWNTGISSSQPLTLTSSQGMTSGFFNYEGQDYNYEESAGLPPSGGNPVTLSYEEAEGYHGVFFSDINSDQFYYKFDFLQSFPTETPTETITIPFLGEEYVINDVSTTEIELIKGSELNVYLGQCEQMSCSTDTYDICIESIGYNGQTHMSTIKVGLLA